MRRISLAVLVLLAGCEVGPDYHRPDAVTSPAFKELAGWKPANPSDLGDRGAWWSVYGDPVLDGLEREVEVSNQNLQAALAAYEESKAVVAEARAQLFPTITASPGVTRSQGSNTSSTTGLSTTSLGTAGTTGTASRSTNRTTYTASSDASWEIDVWGRIRRTVRSNANAAQASAADVANARLSAQATLAIDYFELRSSDEQKRLLDRTISDYQRALTITTNQYNAGTAARSDVLTAQTQLQGAISLDINVGVLRAQLEHAIAVLTGHPPSELTLVPGQLPSAVPVAPAGLPSELLERRPDIAASERVMAEQNEQIGVAIAAYYPTITLSALVDFSGNQFGTLFRAANEVWSLGASAAQTLYSGGARPAAVNAARAVYDQAVANYRQTVLSAFQQVEDELSTLRILEQQYGAQNEAVRLAQQALDVTLNQYRAGTQAFTAVITAQNTLLSDQETLLSLQQQRLVASVTLIEAVGGGWSRAELPDLGKTERQGPYFP